MGKTGKKKSLSVYLSYLLRHNPQDAGLSMDMHGWVDTNALIDGINRGGKYQIDLPQLKQIVADDEKGRYRFNADESRIKACQGHSIPWVVPELTEKAPPQVLYHGTTETAYEKIVQSGAILKMSRHAVHMQADITKAWQSAKRWHLVPVVLVIDAGRMAADGYTFGVSDNEVWCTENVPVPYIADVLVGECE